MKKLLNNIKTSLSVTEPISVYLPKFLTVQSGFLSRHTPIRLFQENISTLITAKRKAGLSLQQDLMRRFSTASKRA
jgi:hypothetical protein